MDASKVKVGIEVFYAPLEQAEIMAVRDDKTRAMIKLLTGPQKGEVIEVPLDDLRTIAK